MEGKIDEQLKTGHVIITETFKSFVFIIIINADSALLFLYSRWMETRHAVQYKITSSSSTNVFIIISISQVKISQEMKGNLQRSPFSSTFRNLGYTLASVENIQLTHVTYLKTLLLSAPSGGSSITYFRSCWTCDFPLRLQNVKRWPWASSQNNDS